MIVAAAKNCVFMVVCKDPNFVQRQSKMLLVNFKCMKCINLHWEYLEWIIILAWLCYSGTKSRKRIFYLRNTSLFDLWRTFSFFPFEWHLDSFEFRHFYPRLPSNQDRYSQVDWEELYSRGRLYSDFLSKLDQTFKFIIFHQERYWFSIRN